MESMPRLAVFLIGLGIGGALSAAYFYGAPTGPMLPSASSFFSSTSPEITPVVKDSGAVAVSDQKAGTVVTIDSVTVPPPGVWVAVRDMSGSDLRNILGAAHAHGPMSNLQISLLRPTIAGGTYAVMLYRDDGSNTFDAGQESVYVDFDTGERVVAFFKTLP